MSQYRLAILEEIAARRLEICDASKLAEDFKLDKAAALEVAFTDETKARERLDAALALLPGTPGVKATGAARSGGIINMVLGWFGAAPDSDSGVCAAGDRACDQSELVKEHNAATAEFEEVQAAHERARRESDAAMEDSKKSVERCDKVRREYHSQEEASRPWKENVDNLQKELDEMSSGPDGARRLAQQRAAELRAIQQERAAVFDSDFEIGNLLSILS